MDEAELGETGAEVDGEGGYTVIDTPVMLMKENTLGTLEIVAAVTSE